MINSPKATGIVDNSSEISPLGLLETNVYFDSTKLQIFAQEIILWYSRDVD